MAVGYVRVAFEDADYDAVPPTNKIFARLAEGRVNHVDSPTTAVHDRLAPEPGDIVVRKTRVGAFSTTDLDEQLRKRGISTVVLAGISTSGVVLSTVRDAADRDYRIIVLADGCADFDAEVHDVLLGKVLPASGRRGEHRRARRPAHGRLTRQQGSSAQARTMASTPARPAMPRTAGRRFRPCRCGRIGRLRRSPRP